MTLYYEPADHEHWRQSPSGIYIPRSIPKEIRYPKPIGVDLFSGCGGFSLGVHTAGFHVVAALEMNHDAAITYCVNLASPGVKFHFDTEDRGIAFNQHIIDRVNKASKQKIRFDSKGNVVNEPELFQAMVEFGLVAGSGWIHHHPGERGCEHFWMADIRNITGKDILDALEVEVGEIDVVFGGPPCQGFSTSNAKRSRNDSRNELVFEFARMVCELRPKAMAMENVPGMLQMTTCDGIPVVDALTRILADADLGTFNSLRKSILQTSGTGLALLSQPSSYAAKSKKTKKQKKPIQTTVGQEQLLL